jgi:flagellar M-ring protein FliF
MDTNGRLLSAAGTGGKSGAYSDAGAFHAQLEAKQKFESENNARVIALLEPVIGEGRVRSNVSAEIDFSQIEQTEEKYNPQSQVIRSQQSSQEARNSAALNPAGVVGARSNDPTTAAPTPAPPAQNAAKSGDQRMATTTNYEIDRTIKKTSGGGGHVNRLTVSVVVDSKTVNGVEVARTPEELQKIQELVGGAIGINAQRGDSVVVQTMAFDKPQPEAETATASFLDRNKQLAPNAIKYGALAFVALLLFLFVIRPARKALKVAFLPQTQPHQLMAAAADSNEQMTAEQRLNNPEMYNQLGEADLSGNRPMLTVAELESQMQSDLENTAVSKDVMRAQTLKKLVAEQTLNNPEMVVNTLRGWLKEA